LLSAFASSPGRAPFEALRTGWRLAPAVLALGATLIAGCGQPVTHPNVNEHGAAGQPTMETEQVVIVNEHLASRPVDLKQGGQFIEPLCNLLPSMIAQQVANDSFEDEPAFGVAYVAETDRPHRPWYPSGLVHMTKYSRDTQDPFNGKRSQKIVVTGKGCRAGISQDGFSLRKGVGYRLRLHMRGEGGVQVRAWLHGDGGTAAGPVDLGRAAAAWAPAEARLLATRSCDNATLTIDAEGPGTLWLDRVYLIGEEAVLGLWRPDVVEVLKRLDPGAIRWGGSAIQGYDWLQGIGPWDRRVPFTTCWGGLEANFVGQEEFVQLCRAVGAEPLLCIRWGPDKAEEAAAQVEYFNGPPETRYGSLRAGYGHREPYKVRYWQIGNEVAGKEYDDSFATIARAMKAVDPSIKTFASCEATERLAGSEYADYLCPHHYGCGDLPAREASFNTHRAFIAREAKGRPVRMAITEWNTTGGDWGLGRGMLQTLSNALTCSRYQNLMHRHADLVEMAMRSNLIDSFGSGTIQTGPGWLYVAPTYHSQRMYQAAAGSWPLKITRPSPPPWHEQQPDLSAVLSPDGRTMCIFAVNATDRALVIAFRFKGFRGGIKTAAGVVLKDREGALSAEAMNSRDDPLRIAPTSRPVEAAGSAFTVVFEPFSLTRLDLGL
jgi:alpha-N-arabinofuranosidase